MVYNKLVRDNIPAIMTQDGQKPVTRTLEGDEYREELRRKLLEEVAEAATADAVEDLHAELADIIEVVYAMALEHGLSREDLEQIRRAKLERNGGFDKKVYLVETNQEEL